MKLGVALPMAGDWGTPEYLVHDGPQGPGRRPLWGSLAEIREDIQRYAEAGLTELFLEPNFQPGGADLARVLDVMEQLAPVR